MVCDGYYYGFACLAAALLLGWLTVPALAAIPLLLGAFFLWFFRDPERSVPTVEGAVVSPAGVISDVTYKRGKFGNAMGAVSAEENEQNIVTVRGAVGTVVFKQIAGLLARRIVFTKKVGDQVACGERVGLIKFGSRVDVVLLAAVEVKVRVGDHVAGGSSLLAIDHAPAIKMPTHDVAEAR